MKQQKLYVFGTGNAAVTRCYNTCFAIQSRQEYFMVDAGGGNGILGILEDMQVPLTRIHHIFVTHEHTDHILGIIWMIRMIATEIRKGSYNGDLKIYCHDGLTETIRTLASLTLVQKFYGLIGDRIHLIPVADGEEKEILGMKLTFFDIHSTKARQFGFRAVLEDGKTLCCAGDEPLNPCCEFYAKDCDWLLHEAFCLYSERALFKPYEKHHSTVKDACELASRLGVRGLILWHTEDRNLSRRSELYLAEGRAFYGGTLRIPADRDILSL